MSHLRNTHDLCAFKGCLTEAGMWGKVLFPFPSMTNPRYEIWLENCGNKSILARSEPKKRKFALCSDHFTPDSFYDEDRKRLRRDAVPEPYSPTFKRLYPLTKPNNRIYDHNYALVPNETDKFLPSYKRNFFPLRKLNAQNMETNSSVICNNKVDDEEDNHVQVIKESGINLGSPRLKKDNRVKTYVRKNLNFNKNDDSIAKASSSVDSGAIKGVQGFKKVSNRLASGSTTVNSESDANMENSVTNKSGRVSGLRDKELGILQETNNELRSQNKLLRKLNGQLKQKMKRSDDRNTRLKIMLEKVSSVDGFLDLHRCMKSTVRKLIKDEIHKCKILGAKK